MFSNLTTWRSDTCDCIIEFNANLNWIKTLQKCRLHKSLDGQILLVSALAMNQRFNLSLGRTPTNAELEDIVISKEVNKARIRKENLDNFHEHLPEHHDLTFFENLKRLLGRLAP